MLPIFKRAIRSKDRDDETDARRFARMVGVLEGVLAETSREYDGLIKRMRELSSRGINETVYAIRPLSEAELAASRDDVSTQLKYAVARTEKLLAQMEAQRSTIEALQAARSAGTL